MPRPGQARPRDFACDRGDACTRRASPSSAPCCSSGSIVGRNILRRIGNLQRSMQLLSGGDLESEIFRSNQRDEVAAMADSLEVFPREHDHGAARH